MTLYREQTVNVGQSGDTVQMKFSDVTLELGFRQAESLANELRLSARAGRRANPPTLKVGDAVRCLAGPFSGQLATVHSNYGDDYAVVFASGSVTVGFAAYELDPV
jgi:transcription antitermination factor NusG